MAFITGPAIHIICLSVVKHKAISEAERNCRRYRGISADDVGQPADVTADVEISLMIILRRRCFRRGITDLSLQSTIVHLFSPLWHGFQGQSPLQSTILPTYEKV